MISKRHHVLLASMVIVISLCMTAQAASISGKIYDYTLEPGVGAIVRLNSTPNQVLFADEGRYTFSIPEGSYLITAELEQGNLKFMSEEEFQVIDKGDYIIDLFLFPKIDEDLLDEDIIIEDPYQEKSYSPILIILLALMAATAFAYFIVLTRINRDQKKLEEGLLDSVLSEVLEILKKNKGIMSQRELRKELSYSEAKVSLMIAELEDLGYIKKLKKGRGNIITLTKK